MAFVNSWLHLPPFDGRDAFASSALVFQPSPTHSTTAQVSTLASQLAQVTAADPF